MATNYKTPKHCYNSVSVFYSLVNIIQLIGSEYAYVFTNDIIIESPISGVNLT